MSNTSPEINIRVIDSEKSLLTLLESISSLVVEPPSLYIDLEGNALGRHGSISILTLHIAPTKKTYLIDIHSLKEAAFSTTTASGTSLKNILESPTIPKVVFDIRNDSDALFSLFQISVDGIKDVQLMELATRNGSRRFVSSLVECIKQDSPISPAAAAEWRGTKERGRRLFAPEKSGRFEVFNKRPLNLEIIQYCENDVSILPALYGVYNDKLRQDSQAFWRVQVREDTKDRIKLSQSAGYNGKSKSMALGWDDHLLEEYMDSWNDDIMMEAMDGTYVLNENDDWVLAERDGLNDFFG
jgi:exonuclease 3'-5' domain-containing protein 1